MEDPKILETIACREALALAEDLNLTHVIIASNSKQAIADIKNGARGWNGSIVHEISLRATLFRCNFCFEGRDANTEAHNLAKFSLSRGPGRHVSLGQPHDLICIPPVVVFDE
uniref:RNase H type-1 domain-containing protein n=1 Tax=Hordeum vulgare subsp. vulgare TaxID=112509 RepID=A0A8I6WUB9_HORVV